MGGGSVKGITIVFEGDTTRLDRALRNIRNSTKDLDKELKSVDKVLKFNPSNVELWKQKQEILRQKIKQTEDNLKDLKDIQAQMDARGVDKQSEAYRTIQREIITAESKLKTFNTQLNKIGQVNLRAASEQVKELGNRLTAAGEAMRGVSMAAAAVTAAIGATTVKSGRWADDLNTMSKRYRIGTKDLQMYSAAADLVDVSVEDIAKTHVKLNKSMLSAQQGSKNQVAAFDALGVSVTNTDGTLRDSDTVWQETIKALGEMTNETERDALAQQLLGKSAANLNPLIEDGGETYKEVAETMSKYGLDFIDQDTLDKANEFNDSLDTIKLVGMVAFQQLGTQLASYLAPAMEKVVEVVGRLAQWFTQLSPRTQAIIAAIAAVLAVTAPLLIGLGKIAFAISSIMSLVATIGPVIAGVVGTVAPIIAIIAAVIAVGVLLYKNWDTIKAKASELWTHITTVFANIQTAIQTKINAIKTFLTAAWNAIKTGVVTAFAVIYNTITSPFTRAYNTVSAVVKKLKGLFPLKIGKIFSGLKLPHFKVSGGKAPWGIGGKGSLPHWSVDWYAKGGIFNSPSIIGIGEAGSEAVVPLDKFWNKLDNMSTGETNITININGANADPTEIANEVKRVLIQETNRRRLAWQ